MSGRIRLVLALALAFTGCDDDDGPGSDLADVATRGADGDPDAVDGSTPPPPDCRVSDAATALPDAEPAPPLPACERACDRVVDCATDGCDGYDWTNAGRLTAECHGVCGGRFAEEMLSLGSCDEVSERLAFSLPGYPQACAENPCFTACRRLGRCIVQECAGFELPADQQIAADCASRCAPGDVAWIEGAGSCEEIVGAIADADPMFGRACRGDAPECATADVCDAYGEKVTTCMLAHCDGRLDAYAEGLQQVLSGYCHTDEACPDRMTVAAIISDDVGCDHPWLRDVGPAPPFGALCAGEVPPEEEVRQACAALLACPGAEGLRNLELCAVFVALRGDVWDAVPCLLAAADCPGRFACLEGE